MPRDTIKIGLLGLGNVGGEVTALLARCDVLIKEKTYIDFMIKRILVRDPSRHRAIQLPPAVLTTAAAAVLDDPEIDVVVELIGGLNRHALILPQR